MEEQRRKYYRLRYPKEERPVADIMGRKFMVTEISERGMRIKFNDIHAASPNIGVSGKIRFHDGEIIEIEGTTFRLDVEELVIKLTIGPDLKRMTKEQLFLRKKYPGYFKRQ
ncbi:PilZ domain-containing protein [Vibrio sp. SCSIO 43136]|uniref:PilZ domain-containing protein n=1 Tax=Vibrio sp. SCSIO 43136 TaxID=2819101 RepID=UPI002076036E|nr:PilZ domain-containing protein [Vibrio sp. SCSIO 43136]USD66758.1 PilZ domain-containing protein [Vibrio sp. SCSIO 43136]